jgi:hypothetical protein
MITIAHRVERMEVVEQAKVADKLSRSKLDKLREEMSIPIKELNKIAKEVVGREFGDVRFLSVTETRRVTEYLRKNYNTLSERYRRIMWTS